MNSSPLLDIFNLDAEPFDRDPEKRICTGYLDTVLSIFEHHSHSFVLISTLAMRWNGANNMPMREIDVLVRSLQLQDIVDDLIASGEWALSQNPNEIAATLNETSIQDIWLESLIEMPEFSAFKYLRLWPEELYHLSVTDCGKIEVPDVLAISTVLLEEEHYRDPHERFGPPRLSAKHTPILPNIEDRAKLVRRDIPIYVPTIQDHLNALLDQLREQTVTKLKCGNEPEWQIGNFIRYHYLDWAPARSWLLSSKIYERNLALMEFRLDRFRRKQLILYDMVLRKSVFDKMPWELTIRPKP